MTVVTKQLSIRTRGEEDIQDITDKVAEAIAETKLKNGVVTIFVPGSTGALTTIEYEPGLKKDLPRVMDQIAPYEEYYEHHKTWGDDNGSGHVKASIIGPSIIVPFKDGDLILGRWQQIVVINFDTRRRKRNVILQILRS